MQVVLLKDVPSLGKAGEVVSVAEGYARNYLIPRKLAEPVSPGKLEELKRVRQQREKKQEEMQRRAERVAVTLKDRTIPVRAKVGEGGRLFGAVTAKDIAVALERECGIAIDKKQIALPVPLKELGTYPVTVKLAPGISVTVRVAVRPE
ncbi:50S ribosomal protein L9 [Thermodesulfitimonas sp.]